VLEAVFDYDELRRRLVPGKLDWTLLSAVEPEHFPAFPVGNTPLCAVARLGQELGLPRLFVKNEGLNPSGSLKDRASFLVAAEALRLGEGRIVAASTGNAASALAAVCAAAGLQALIFVPESAPRGKLLQMLLFGATVVTVKGSYDDAFRLSLDYTAARGGLNRNTAYHPLTLEGKKTVSLEIYDQLGGRAPDAVLVPVGDGVILAGVHKGFLDLLRLGLIDRLPRLIAVQAERSDAIHRYFATGSYSDAHDPGTVADSISVACPSHAHGAVRALRESDGLALTVTDAAILDAQARLARSTGIFAEPAAAAALAGLEQLQQRSAALPSSATVVLLATGHGLKDIEAPLGRIRIPLAIEPTLSAVTV
jgi:threonine synthase